MVGKEDDFIYFPIGFRPIFRVELLNFGGVNVFFEHLKSTKEISVEKFTNFAGEGGEGHYGAFSTRK